MYQVLTVSESRSVVSDSLRPLGVAHQAPPSMEFSRQEYWSGLPFPSPGDLPDPGIQADALTSEPPKDTLTVKEEQLFERALKT